MANEDEYPITQSILISVATESLCSTIKIALDQVRDIVRHSGNINSICNTMLCIIHVKSAITDILVPSLLDPICHRVICYFDGALGDEDRNMENILLYYLGADRCIDFCAQIITLAVSPHLYKLDITTVQSRYLLEALIAGELEYPNIQILMVPKLEKHSVIQALDNRIRNLNKLLVFDFKYSCNDYIIKTISENCPNIVNLNVRLSTEVTNVSVPYLNKLLNLKSLSVNLTSITTAGYRKILNTLPELTTIFWNMEEKNLLTGIKFDHLPKVNHFVGSVHSSQTLVDKCPNIVDLALMAVESDLSPLSQLTSLSSLLLGELNFRLCNLRKVFPYIGQKLTSLNLFFIDQLDISPIIVSCLVLEKLTITGCDFFSPVIYINSNLPHFLNLRYLTMIRNVNDQWYLSCKMYYRNLLRFITIN